MLLHGLTCNAAYWLRVLPLIAGVRAIALDFRGHGLSEHRDSYRYADYENDLVALLDDLDLDRVALVGHSLGGYVGLLAAAHTDRVASVLAIDVKSDWTDTDAALAERSRGASQRAEPDRDHVVERLRRSLPGSTVDDRELELLAERSVEPVEDGWRLRWDRRVLATEPVEPYEFLAAVRCPVHVMAGSASEVMPPEAARRFAAAIPGATVEIVDGIGHHVELEAPGRIASYIRELLLAEHL